MILFPFTERSGLIRMLLCRSQISPCHCSLCTLFMPFGIVLGRLCFVKMVRPIIYKTMQLAMISIGRVRVIPIIACGVTILATMMKFMKSLTRSICTFGYALCSKTMQMVLSPFSLFQPMCLFCTRADASLMLIPLHIMLGITFELVFGTHAINISKSHFWTQANMTRLLWCYS